MEEAALISAELFLGYTREIMLSLSKKVAGICRFYYRFVSWLDADCKTNGEYLIKIRQFHSFIRRW